MDDNAETIGLSEHAKETLRRASVEVTTFELPGYEITEQLGRGTYGVVWRARRLKTGQDVAIKVLDESKGLNWGYFRRELALLIDLEEHPHTLTILDAQLDSSPPLIVMPLAEGGSLESAINSRGFSLEQKEEWIKQMALALDFIHSRGVIHSDLKPSNVLLTASNSILIADFGQARRSEQAGALGTLGFMPPEQCEGRGASPSISWDVYGFGATAYWMLTGELPRYRSGSSGGVDEYARQLKARPIQPIRKLEPEVDRELAVVVERCLEPDPANRTRGLDVVLIDLERRKQKKPLLCRRPWRPGYLVRTYSQWTSVRLMFLLLLLLAGILGYQWRERQERLFDSYLMKGSQANDTGRYEEAYLNWAEALTYKGDYRPLEVLLGFRPLELVLNNKTQVLDFVLVNQGRQLVTAENSGLVTLWDLNTGKVLRTWPHPLGVSRLALDPQRRYLATASFDGVTRVYDLTNGELVTEQGVAGTDSLAVEAVAFVGEGRFVASSDYLGTIKVQDLNSDTPVPLEDVATDDALPILSPHPTLPKIAGAPAANRPCVWDLETGKAALLPVVHSDTINDIAWLPQGRMLTAGEDSLVYLWDGDEPLRKFQHENPVSVLLPLSDKLFAAGCRDGSVRIWDIEQEEPVHKLRLRRPILTLDQDKESDILAVGTGEDQDLWSEAEANGTVNLFDLSTGFQVGGPWPCDGPVNKVRFQTGKHRLVTLSSDGFLSSATAPVYIKVWNYLVPERSQTSAVKNRQTMVANSVDLPGGGAVTHGDVAINDYSFHDATDRLVTAGDDWTVRIWDSRDGELLHRPFELRGPARGVVFSQRGDLLASAAQQQFDFRDDPVLVRVWDAETGLQVSPILTCPGVFQSMEFTDDATRISVVTSEGRFEWPLAVESDMGWKSRLEDQFKVKLDKRGGLQRL